jgi:hypothetical protein
MARPERKQNTVSRANAIDLCAEGAKRLGSSVFRNLDDSQSWLAYFDADLAPEEPRVTVKREPTSSPPREFSTGQQRPRKKALRATNPFQDRPPVKLESTPPPTPNSSLSPSSFILFNSDTDSDANCNLPELPSMPSHVVHPQSHTKPPLSEAGNKRRANATGPAEKITKHGRKCRKHAQRADTRTYDFENDVAMCSCSDLTHVID